ncbi:NAD(P)-binding domain-containing protein [Kitasatospora sp. NRRL B-11411]|uniref:imine reductase family protein n=1 Tax=Kitasatospora sp. NRRL B-11411 TaxID=1463822 RepID=UPI0009E026A0|nr:NAD(P)-binding domain-containing protein [Kitasatospora sp. NRRL B-11411]
MTRNTRDDGKGGTAVAVLGLGPMGRALAAAFGAAGHRVTVWNRTPGKAAGLPVEVAGSVAGAVAAGTVVVACLAHREALEQVLAQAPDGWQGRTLVNLTSGPPDEARRLAGWAAGRGAAYLDGAVLTPTRTIGTPGATVLVSGLVEVFGAVRGTLAATGGAVLHLGAEVGLAGAHETALLDLFATSVHGLAHAFALAAAEGIDPGRFAPLAAGIGDLLAVLAADFAEQLAAGSFPGTRSTLAAARSGLTHALDASARHGLDTGVLAAARSALDRALAAGHGAEGLARLAAVLAEPVARPADDGPGAERDAAGRAEGAGAVSR